MGGDDNDIGPDPTEQEEEVCFDFYTNEIIVQSGKDERKCYWPIKSVL